MHATWKFRAARSRGQYSWVRRACGHNSFTGTEHDALAFAARIVEHLNDRDIKTVQAWSVGPISGTPDQIPNAAVCPIVPHQNGTDWSVLDCSRQHCLWVKKWQDAIDYMLFRAAGQLCVIHVLGTTGQVAHAVLADRRDSDWGVITGPPVASRA